MHTEPGQSHSTVTQIPQGVIEVIGISLAAMNLHLHCFNVNCDGKYHAHNIATKLRK